MTFLPNDLTDDLDQKIEIALIDLLDNDELKMLAACTENSIGHIELAIKPKIEAAIRGVLFDSDVLDKNASVIDFLNGGERLHKLEEAAAHWVAVNSRAEEKPEGIPSEMTFISIPNGVASCDGVGELFTAAGFVVAGGGGGTTDLERVGFLTEDDETDLTTRLSRKLFDFTRETIG